MHSAEKPCRGTVGSRGFVPSTVIQACKLALAVESLDSVALAAQSLQLPDSANALAPSNPKTVSQGTAHVQPR